MHLNWIRAFSRIVGLELKCFESCAFVSELKTYMDTYYENVVRNREIARNEQFLLFLTKISTMV